MAFDTTQFAARAFWAIEGSAQHLEAVAEEFSEMGDKHTDEEYRSLTYSLADSYRMAAKEVRRQIPAYLEHEARNLATVKAWDKASAPPVLEQWEPMKFAPAGIGPDYERESTEEQRAIAAIKATTQAIETLGRQRDKLQQEAYAEGRKDEAEDRSMSLQDVWAERVRQVEALGYTPEHDDDEHADGAALVDAAAAYCVSANDVECARATPPSVWPWDASDWKPRHPRRMLVKAAALILARIDQMDRIRGEG